MATQLDLTQGVIWRRLTRYAVPIVLSSLLQSAYAMADLIIAGHYVGADGLSAINNASQITHLLTQLITGLATGGNILMSQYYGSHDREGRQQANTTLFSLALVLGTIMAVAFYCLAEPIMAALGAPSLELAAEYLRICAIGLLPIFGYNVLSAATRAVGNSRLPLYCIAVTTVVNIVLDIVFVGFWGMGVGGAAWATVIAQTLSCLVCLVYVLRQRELFSLSLGKLYIRPDKLKTMLKLGLPCSMQMAVGGISWLTVTFLVNRYGVEASAANGVCGKIKDVCQLFSSAMASASATMVAQCLGAGLYDRASKVVHTAMRIAMAMAAGIIVVVEFSAPVLVRLFTDDPLTIQYAVQNLRIEIIAQIFYASFLVYNSLAIGAGHSLFAMGSSFVNCILVRLVLAIVLNHYLGLTGVFLACMIAPSSSVPLGYIYERTGVWRRSLVGAKGKEAAP